MSLYTALGIEMPVMSYCALHQVRKGVPEDEYRKTMRDLHLLVNEETKKLNALWSLFEEETASHAAKSLRGQLSQFLTTPLKSDSEEIQSIFKTHLIELGRQLRADQHLGTLTATEGQLSWEGVAGTSLKKLLLSGKAYLEELSFDVGKERTEIFESCFLIRGGVNFDVLEHIVRDRIGIYTPVHGKHITEFASYAYAAHNLVYLSGQLEASGPMEWALFFSKGSTRYEPFRNGLKELFDRLQKEYAFPHVSVWQRKLGLGAGREFVLRIRSGNHDHLAAVVQEISRQKEKPFIPESLINGHLLLKKLVKAHEA